MIPILLTTTNEKQPGCVVVWDLLGGCPIATLFGDVACSGSLLPFLDGVACASLKKPLLQYWNFKTANCVSRRILAKGLVTALDLTSDGEYVFIAIGRDVYVYQTASGCLLAILGDCHSVNIGALKIVSYNMISQNILVTADSSGFLACWSLTGIMDNLSLLSSSVFDSHELSNRNTEAGPQSDIRHSRLWYTVHASHELPRFVAIRKLLLVAGTEGLKIFDLLTGSVLGVGLTDILGGLRSICHAPFPDTRLFCGGSDGILYTTHVSERMKQIACDKETHRCFISANLTSAQKSITELCIPKGHPDLLIVGSCGGLIEVLRLDSILSCLQQFSVLNPSTTNELSSPSQLTGLCVLPRPDWLSGATSISDNLMHKETYDATDEDNARLLSKSVCGVEPLKPHFGWLLDDLVRVRLPGTESLPSTDSHVYMDEFGSRPVSTKPEPEQSNDPSAEIDRLTKANRELLRKLVDYELRS